MKTETPRTDAECGANETDGGVWPCVYVTADFARSLEKELAQAEADAKRFRWLIKQGVAWRDCYDANWLAGEWLYAVQDARSFVDKAMASAAMPNLQINLNPVDDNTNKCSKLSARTSKDKTMPVNEQYAVETANAQHDYEVIKNKELRQKIDAQIQEVKALPPSRERSICITKLQEAVMWLGMDLKRLNEPNPYPNSKDPSNTKIEPTADNLKL